MSRRFQRYFVQQQMFRTLCGGVAGSDTKNGSYRSRFVNSTMLVDLLECDLARGGGGRSFL